MRNLHRATFLFLAVFVIAACGPTEDDDGHEHTPTQSPAPTATPPVERTVESGIYRSGDTIVQVDECDLGLTPESIDGLLFDIDVDGDTLAIAGPHGTFELLREGDALTGTSTGTWTSSDFNCSLSYEFQFLGVVTAPNSFDLQETDRYEYFSGFDCGQLMVDLPCRTIYSARFRKQ